jgi:hypothetical protein
MRKWSARVFALLALAAAGIAIYLAISSVHSTKEITGDDAAAWMQQLATANGALSDRLEPLKPGASPKEAQDETRRVADLTRQLEGSIDGGGDLADRLEQVYAAELTYLDAVGSTLNNPNSALRTKIGPTAQALRDVLQQVPGGDHRAIRGGLALVQYSAARAADSGV